MTTAKKMGFKKGDWVRLRDSNWVAKLISDVHTACPVAFVFGFYEEAGSVYASDLVKLPIEVQARLERDNLNKVKSFKAPLKIDA